MKTFWKYFDAALFPILAVCMAFMGEWTAAAIFFLIISLEQRIPVGSVVMLVRESNYS